MASERLISALVRAVGEENVITDPEKLEAYSRDESPELSAMPDLVVTPTSSGQVEAAVRACYEHFVPITPRGAGTGVAGGAVPVRGGLVLSLEKMKGIVEIDRKNLLARALPGTITANLQDAVEREGLYYPPDPASVDSCSIGGNAATNAGGMRAFKYGTTKKFVQGLEVVVPPGRLLRLGGKMIKDVAGYDILSLFVGSEGTLGIITEVMVRLLPKPAAVVDLLAGFSSVGDAAEAALSIVSATGVMPAAMELVESEVVDIVEKFSGKRLPLSGTNQLIVSIDGDVEQVDDDFVKVGEHLLSCGAKDVLVANMRTNREFLWKARRGIREALRSRSPDIVAEDVAVPPTQVPKLIDGIKRIAHESGTCIVAFGHVGDGNIHVDLLRDQMDRAQWEEAKRTIVPKILRLAVELGGTITGEHGIGYLKREYIHLCRSRYALEKMKALKDAIDPAGLMNPDKVFP